jgi:ankyrin repeat protein
MNMNRKKSLFQWSMVFVCLGVSGCGVEVPSMGIPEQNKIPEKCPNYSRSEFGEYILKGQISKVREGIECGVDLNKNYETGSKYKVSMPPLWYALENESLEKLLNQNSKEMIEILLKAGADINQTHDGDVLVNKVMSLDSRYWIAKSFIYDYPALDLNKPGYRYPLEMAISQNKFWLAIQFLKRGANPNLGIYNQNLVQFALNMAPNFDSSTKDLIHLMLNKGASVSVDQDEGQELLIRSIREKNKWLFGELLAKGASMHKPNIHNETPLMAAVRIEPNFYHAMIGSMNQADFDYANDDFETAVVIAIKNGSNRIAVDLIERGSKVTYETADQQNLLHLAVSKNSSDVEGLIKILVDKGLNINSKDTKGQTALAIAKTKRDPILEKFLLSLGAR